MKISSKAELDAAIIALERRKLHQEVQLIDQFNVVRDSMNPVNFIKNTITKLAETPNVGGGILKILSGLSVGILSKKLLIGKSSSVLTKLLSGVFELAVAKTAISNVDKVKAYGISIYHNLFKKNSNHVPESSNGHQKTYEEED
jgi:hypothetical protein